MTGFAENTHLHKVSGVYLLYVCHCVISSGEFYFTRQKLKSDLESFSDVNQVNVAPKMSE